ncbi:hypothetical protein GE21DRAFT_6770 [Neurospora crassa]|uniref:Uncharacterized protein n=1 Tax=Neurospora crassa (strain ATCC 24698 / 74-OR23-1A / CBS 708.71 / DSM 1257 / FGSC 987) TaxID=367110 RepID=Q7S8G2_NEUCR|nr:hypothetical protein NCU05171 [Neurospora crassa OR74A]EAA32639.2 hypothetical protein NCU05171 [Neurospora crassa OR74A]KHE79535.1 hypothetical protein GE21DRAFT_6770 [Neurospora crassa]|eukprot:XP_961875.2 hypothetical protein NCU05171 [Neurospora crassa OR74A]
MPVDVSQLEQQLKGKTKELSVLQARISELENELKAVEQLKARLTDQTQKLSTSERRVAELEKRLQDAQTASVKTVEGLTNQFGQKTKETSVSKGCFSDVEKKLNGALATSQANIKLAQDAWASSQKLGDKVKDLVSQVSGLKSALVIVDEGSQAVTEEGQNPNLNVRCLQNQVQKLTASYSELHANAEHCIAFLNDYTGYRLTIDS